MRPHRFMRTALFTALSVIDDADARRTRRLALGPVEDPLRLSTAVDPMGDPAQSTTRRVRPTTVDTLEPLVI